MRVHHFCTLPTGGAATAARRLHQGLVDRGVDSLFWTAKLPVALQTMKTYQVVPWIPSRSVAPRAWYSQLQWFIGKRLQTLRLKRHLDGRPTGLDFFSLPRPGFRSVPDPVQSPDIINLHWISGLIDYPSFFGALPPEQPVVWTLHDMNPLTGGCHYNHGCRRFSTGCGDCPQLGLSGPEDLSREAFQIKQQALANVNLTVVAPSRWLLQEARQSPILASARRFERLPYGLDTEQFRPGDRTEARQSFGLPLRRFIIGLGAAAIDCRRKGLAEALIALRHLERPQETSVVVFGAGGNKTTPLFDASLESELQSRGLEFHRTGYVTNPSRLAQLYASLNVFLLPSLEDNLPQTGLESLACGVPVAAFDSGGISDFVRHDETGLLAPPGDTRQLAHHLNTFMRYPAATRRMATRARQVACSEYNTSLQAERYEQLYWGLTARRFAA